MIHDYSDSQLRMYREGLPATVWQHTLCSLDIGHTMHFLILTANHQPCRSTLTILPHAQVYPTPPTAKPPPYTKSPHPYYQS
jgi:hypothetical protein